MRKIKLQRKSFFGKVLRAFGKDSGIELPLPSREKKTSGVSAYSPHYDYHKQLRNTMLQAEKHKAKAIMEYKRHNLARLGHSRSPSLPFLEESFAVSCISTSKFALS